MLELARILFRSTKFLDCSQAENFPKKLNGKRLRHIEFEAVLRVVSKSDQNNKFQIKEKLFKRFINKEVISTN